MRAVLLLFDRTAILFLGVAAGVAIGYAFGVHQQVEPPTVASLPGSAPPPVTGGNLATLVPGSPALPAVAVHPGPAEQPTVEQSRPLTPGVASAVAAGRPIRIGVFGDSFGDGIWSALYNQLSRKAGYQVVKFSQQATGFTRYKTLNLEEHDRTRLAGAPVDVAVISFGANDMMGVAAGGHVYALLSPKWQEEIGRRVTSYIAMLRDQGAIVYWVGLPKMREASYDADVVRMNGFYRGLMAQLGVPFIETAPYSVDADGRYAAYLPDAAGKPTLMRANDGIHMSMNGYIRITRGLSGRIRAYVDRAKGEPGGATPPAPVALPETAPAPPPRIVPPAPRPPREPRLEDPLADQPSAPPPPTRHVPAGKGAPIDLLPPDIGVGSGDGNNSQ